MPTQAQKNRFNKAKQSYMNMKKKKQVTTLVKREFDKRVEIKNMRPLFSLQNRITNFLSDPALQSISLTPQIAQGSGQGQRNGNRVRTKRAICYLTCSADQLTNSSGYVPPIYIDIYIYKSRKTNTQSSLPLNQFLQNGDTSTNYDSSSNLFSGNFDINSDQFNLKKKKRILLWNQPMTQTDSSVNPQSINNCKDLINARTLRFDITKYLKKNMDFQDDVTNTPSDNLFISCVFTPNDYETTYVQNQVLGQFSVMLKYDYEDA